MEQRGHGTRYNVDWVCLCPDWVVYELEAMKDKDEASP